jgi:hypothetical protein
VGYLKEGYIFIFMSFLRGLLLVGFLLRMSEDICEERNKIEIKKYINIS